MSSRDILVNVGEDQTVAITVFNNEISLEYLKKSFDRVKTLVYYKKDNIMCYMPMESDIFLLPPSQNEFVLIRNEKGKLINKIFQITNPKLLNLYYSS